MVIIIKNRFNVLKYVPEVPTYVIRIINSESREELRPLTTSPLFREINIYRINDTTFDSRGNGPVPDGISEKLITDFASSMLKFSDIQDILVHCNEGKSRSPAIGGALNEIFNLGYETWRIYVDFPGCNEHVYKQLVSTARKIGILPVTNRRILFDAYKNAE